MRNDHLKGSDARRLQTTLAGASQSLELIYLIYEMATPGAAGN